LRREREKRTLLAKGLRFKLQEVKQNLYMKQVKMCGDTINATKYGFSPNFSAPSHE
jgi:hypothetical protein